MKTIKALEPITAYGPDKLALFVGETAEIEDSFADALIDEGKAEEYSGGSSSDNTYAIGSEFTYDPQSGYKKIVLDKTWAEIVQASESGKLVYFLPLVYTTEDPQPHIYFNYNLTLLSYFNDPNGNCYIYAISSDGMSLAEMRSYTFLSEVATGYPVFEETPG